MRFLKITTFLFSLICIFVANNLLAQKQTNHWFFGEHIHIDFNHTPPKVSIRDSNYADIWDGGDNSNSISDKNGNLLFFTNGAYVWNKNNTIMANGYEISGTNTYTAAHMIVPIPTTNKYYIFAVTNPAKNLMYTIVDMDLNGGLGDIESKNNLLQTKVKNEIIAIGTDNCMGSWLVAHEHITSNFLAYKIDNNGLNTTPVVTTIGIGMNWLYDNNLKCSHDGSKIVLSNLNSYANTSDPTVKGRAAQMFDFNKQTGKLSNLITFYQQAHPFLAIEKVEFSPDNKLLYTVYGYYDYVNGLIVKTYGYVNQYDISSNNENLINASPISIASGGFQYSDLELGSDGKIYTTHYPDSLFVIMDPVTYRYNKKFISVIDNPNSRGTACSFRYKALITNIYNAGYFLPKFIRNYFNKLPRINYSHACLNDSTSFSLTPSNFSAPYLWNFGDPLSGSNNTSSLPKPKHLFDTEQKYLVSFTSNLCQVTDTIEVTEFLAVNIGQDTTICDGASILLNTHLPNLTTQWNTGETTSSINASHEQLYNVTVSNTCDAFTDSLYLHVIPRIIPAFVDTTSCDQFSLEIHPKVVQDNINYTWSTGETTPYIKATEEREYSVTLKNQCFELENTFKVNFASSTGNPSHMNLMTTNNDQKNDCFIPLLTPIGVEDFNLSIYNSWGSRVYETNDPVLYWKGDKDNTAIYYYQMHFKNCLNKEVSYNGWLQVIH